jgi:hypothetical protein
MSRVLFLLLVVMNSVVFAQIEEKPQAVNVDEFEKVTNGYVKMKMDYFYAELNNNPSAQGYIINYGIAKEIAIRERQIRDALRFRRFDPARITIVNGGFRGVVKSEFWLIPAGADNPKIESSSKLFDEFEKVTIGDIKARIDNLFIELANNPDAKVYIVNYGTAGQILAREKLIRQNIAFLRKEISRVTFVKGGAAKTIRTEFWIDSPKTEK